MYRHPEEFTTLAKDDSSALSLVIRGLARERMVSPAPLPAQFDEAKPSEFVHEEAVI